MKSTLTKRATMVASQGIFLGGPIGIFESAGRKTFMLMLDQGLTPDSEVLDIGCGCLRNGYWLIHFLNSGHYCGIEPNVAMLKAGQTIVVGDETLSLKNARFDNNDRFDFSVFSTGFDMYLARSIWTHASKQQIVAMLDSFVRTSNAEAKLLTSIHEALKPEQEYLGDEWVGLSHDSSKPGMVCHSLKWIREQCAARDLTMQRIENDYFTIADQSWLSIQRT